MPLFPKRSISLAAFLLLIVGGGAGMATLWWENQANRREREALTEQLRQATEAQKEATITRRVSTQLEEIAYQQKEISDIQRQEAVNQKQIADQMREHAELERERALLAQQAAVESYNQMEEQKRIAELRREEAVEARMKADTLARLALGRSLGAQASTQYALGNEDLASLLSYSAWKFTSENKGDVYQPAIFDALSQTSDLSQRWGLHKGAIRDIMPYYRGQEALLLSASQYGELFLWKTSGNDLIRECVWIDDPKYDFRKIELDKTSGRLFVLSFTGQVISIDGEGNLSEIPLPGDACVGMGVIRGDLFVASKKGDIWKAQVNKWNFTLVYHHPHTITACEISDKGLIVGDDQGSVYRIDERGQATVLADRVKQPVTCVYSDAHSGILMIGYKSGLVVLDDVRDGVSSELSGHISPITAIRFLGGRLFTSSYDGTVRLWNINNENKTASSIVYRPSEWIHTFIINPDGERIFTGDEKGNLSSVSISPDYMASEIRSRLTRNFTREEWDYYIGEVSAYETYR